MNFTLYVFIVWSDRNMHRISLIINKLYVTGSKKMKLIGEVGTMLKFSISNTQICCAV